MRKEKLDTKDGNQFTVFYLGDQNKNIAEDWGWIPSLEEEHDFDSPAISLDDTIESDYVKNPVSGRIYKIKPLEGTVARLKEIVSNFDFGSETTYARMSLHGTEFLVNVGDLVKATEFEVEEYLEKC